MIDDSILTKINKMKRKKLMSFISDHDRDGGQGYSMPVHIT